MKKKIHIISLFEQENAFWNTDEGAIIFQGALSNI